VEYPSDDAIKTAIYLYGPVAAGVYAESTFDSYRSGILEVRPVHPMQIMLSLLWDGER
jgi:hypothetical protein